MTSCHESFGVGGVSGARNNNLALGGQIVQIKSTAEKWNCHGHLFHSLLVYRLPLSKKHLKFRSPASVPVNLEILSKNE
jgi:hypothetical protein